MSLSPLARYMLEYHRAWPDRAMLYLPAIGHNPRESVATVEPPEVERPRGGTDPPAEFVRENPRASEIRARVTFSDNRTLELDGFRVIRSDPAESLADPRRVSRSGVGRGHPQRSRLQDRVRRRSASRPLRLPGAGRR